MATHYSIALAIGGRGGAADVYISSPHRPSCFKAELSQPMSTSESSVYNDAASSSARRHDLVFVVNPQGANGRTGNEWKRLLPYLRTHIGKDCNICESLTSGPAHAIDITREAIREGAEAVIVVGGDGTLHEGIKCCLLA